jgi:hypothetical protein
MSIDTAIKRITDYVVKKIDVIEELEEERLSYSRNGTIPQSIDYVNICSASRV